MIDPQPVPVFTNAEEQAFRADHLHQVEPGHWVMLPNCATCRLFATLDAERSATAKRIRRQVRATYSISADLVTWVRDQAEKDGTPISVVVATAIESMRRLGSLDHRL